MSGEREISAGRYSGETIKGKARNIFGGLALGLAAVTILSDMEGVEATRAGQELLVGSESLGPVESGQQWRLEGDALAELPGICKAGARVIKSSNVSEVYLRQRIPNGQNVRIIDRIIMFNDIIHLAGPNHSVELDWSNPDELLWTVIDSTGLRRETLPVPRWFDRSREAWLGLVYDNVPGERETMFFQDIIGGSCVEPRPSPVPPIDGVVRW